MTRLDYWNFSKILGGLRSQFYIIFSNRHFFILPNIFPRYCYLQNKVLIMPLNENTTALTTLMRNENAFAALSPSQASMTSFLRLFLTFTLLCLLLIVANSLKRQISPFAVVQVTIIKCQVTILQSSNSIVSCSIIHPGDDTPKISSVTFYYAQDILYIEILKY